MKKLILAALLLNGCHAVPAYAAEPETLCEVKVCNKLERLTLDPFKMIGDSMGEQCFNVTLPKKEAVEGSFRTRGEAVVFEKELQSQTQEVDV